MKKQKAFDCVQMKWNIQQKIAQEFAAVPEEEALRRQRERIEQNPILARFLARVRRVQEENSLTR